MMTHEIPQDQWPRFFDDFSRRHIGKAVTVELLRPDYGQQRTMQCMLLLGIAYERHNGADPTIEIFAGDPDRVNSIHVVDDPSHIWISEEMAKEEATLMSIESEDGVKTLIRLEPSCH